MGFHVSLAYGKCLEPIIQLGGCEPGSLFREPHTHTHTTTRAASHSPINTWFSVNAKNNFVPLFKSVNADVLKCKACLKSKLKCVHATMCSLAMSLFSRDHIKTEIDYN